MRHDVIDLPPVTPGTRHALHVQRFGTPGARPHVVLQAALHADELPGSLALHHLRERLAADERAGALLGEITLVPFANPLGLAQQGLGVPVGRFALADGSNFNRGFPLLDDIVAERIAKELTDDLAVNRTLIRRALRTALSQQAARTAVEHLRSALLGLAIDADVVLDLHCDGEALMHLYALPQQVDTASTLGRLLGAEVLLLSDDSGGEPFDESCSRPWLRLQRRFPDRPIPLACFAATVELRGQADVDTALATQDAAALHAFLIAEGAIAGRPPELPTARFTPTPLAGSEPIESPVGGVVAFHHAPGARLAAGDPVADVIDPVAGTTTTLRASAAGLLYARIDTRLALPGKRLAKIAGTTVQRTGRLLSP